MKLSRSAIVGALLLAAGALLALACIDSQGEPGDLCWEPTDCAPIRCACPDGYSATARTCLSALACADEEVACAIAGARKVP